MNEPCCPSSPREPGGPLSPWLPFGPVTLKPDGPGRPEEREEEGGEGRVL